MASQDWLLGLTGVNCSVERNLMVGGEYLTNKDVDWLQVTEA